MARQSEQPFPTDPGTAEATFADLAAWPGWASDGFAKQYFAGGKVVDWEAMEEAFRKGQLRHASLRLAAVEWNQGTPNLSSRFPYFDVDAAPYEILGAVVELAAFYARRPEERFRVISSDAQQAVSGASFGFRYGWAKFFYGDLPESTMALIQNFVAAPTPQHNMTVPQTTAGSGRGPDLRSLPGWGVRTGGR